MESSDEEFRDIRNIGMTYDAFVRDRLPPPELLPEFRFDLPEVRYPEQLNSAVELLKGGEPDAPAVLNRHGRWTYAELDDFSGRIARLLVEEESLIPGNRVFLRGPNSYTMFAAWLGVLRELKSRGLTTPDPAEAAVKRLMLDCAAMRILLADHSKFGVVNGTKHADLADIDVLISDTGLTDDQNAQLRSAGVQVERT